MYRRTQLNGVSQTLTLEEKQVDKNSKEGCIGVQFLETRGIDNPPKYTDLDTHNCRQVWTWGSQASCSIDLKVPQEEVRKAVETEEPLRGHPKHKDLYLITAYTYNNRCNIFVRAYKDIYKQGKPDIFCDAYLKRVLDRDLIDSDGNYTGDIPSFLNIKYRNT